MFFINRKKAEAEEFCRRWVELRSDAEGLWDRGEIVSWDDGETSRAVERFVERRRSYEALERAEPDMKFVVECERLLYRKMGWVWKT